MNNVLLTQTAGKKDSYNKAGANRKFYSTDLLWAWSTFYFLIHSRTYFSIWTVSYQFQIALESNAYTGLKCVRGVSILKQLVLYYFLHKYFRYISVIFFTRSCFDFPKSIFSNSPASPLSYSNCFENYLQKNVHYSWPPTLSGWGATPPATLPSE